MHQKYPIFNLVSTKQDHVKWVLRIYFFSEAEYELEKTEKVLQESLNERAVETKKFQEQASQLLYF